MTDKIPPGSRNNDWSSSIEGEQSSAAINKTLRKAILAAHLKHPLGLTDDEAAVFAYIDIFNSSICWWKRASELRALGYTTVFHDDGTSCDCTTSRCQMAVKRVSTTGYSNVTKIVSRITPAGIMEITQR